MKEGPDISHIAALIGDPGRANILTALMAGKALTASELAAEVGVALPTASGHLSKLVAGGLLAARKQGRHKYFALAGPDVATLLEALMGLAAGRALTRVRPGPRDAAMRQARVCYNHLAGARGVQLYTSLSDRGFLRQDAENLVLTPGGGEFMQDFGIALAELQATRVPLCRECLDWSERKSHLAGSLGRAILGRIETQGWAARDPKSRAVVFNPAGIAAFDAAFPPGAVSN
jgi:DNA-binding transcriptional ArsR family regulator